MRLDFSKTGRRKIVLFCWRDDGRIRREKDRRGYERRAPTSGAPTKWGIFIAILNKLIDGRMDDVT
jgi:hypothetical protein